MTKAISNPIKSVSISYVCENAVLLEWSEKICPKQHQHIMFCQQRISTILNTKIIDSIVSFASLIIYYKFNQITHDELHMLLLDVVNTPFSPIENFAESSQMNQLHTHSHSRLNSQPKQNSNQSPNNKLSHKPINIPVYYGEDSGWDLAAVSHATQLNTHDIIHAHSKIIYRAYALGFTPGFCYLGELPASLQLPRKSSPRLSVPKGAVAIAEKQTAIYPHSSPGGWHIIGQTPIEMYSVKNKVFHSTINVGQSVRFIPINKKEFTALGGNVIEENAL